MPRDIWEGPKHRRFPWRSTHPPGFPGTHRKEPASNAGRCRRRRFDPWVWKILWRRAWQPTLVFLSGESHGQRSLVGCSSWGRKSWTRLKRLSSSSSKVVLVVKSPPSSAGDIRDAGLIPGSGRFPGEAHGNPLQYSCLENPMDRGA